MIPAKICGAGCQRDAPAKGFAKRSIGHIGTPYGGQNSCAPRVQHVVELQQPPATLPLGRNAPASTSIKDAMPNPFSVPLTFYPAYCFPLSPTHNTWARLTASDVHALRERTGFEGTSTPFTLSLLSIWACSPATQYAHCRLAEISLPHFQARISTSTSTTPSNGSASSASSSL